MEKKTLTVQFWAIMSYLMSRKDYTERSAILEAYIFAATPLNLFEYSLSSVSNGRRKIEAFYDGVLGIKSEQMARTFRESLPIPVHVTTKEDDYGFLNHSRVIAYVEDEDIDKLKQEIENL